MARHDSPKLPPGPSRAPSALGFAWVCRRYFDVLGGRWGRDWENFRQKASPSLKRSLKSCRGCPGVRLELLKQGPGGEWEEKTPAKKKWGPGTFRFRSQPTPTVDSPHHLVSPHELISLHFCRRWRVKLRRQGESDASGLLTRPPPFFFFPRAVHLVPPLVSCRAPS